LFIPVLACVLPSTFNRRTPEMFGIPFFYWYQLLLVPLGSVFIWLVIGLEAARRRSDRIGGDQQ